MCTCTCTEPNLYQSGAIELFAALQSSGEVIAVYLRLSRAKMTSSDQEDVSEP